jgi:hypothetical protein
LALGLTLLFLIFFGWMTARWAALFRLIDR